MKRKKIAAFCLLVLSTGCSSLTMERRIRAPIEADYSVESTEFRDSMGNLLGAPMVDGNNVVELLNGDRIFSSMLEAIRGAKKTITFEMYIWSSGKESDPFVEALAERARAGVKVHVVVDSIGSARLKRADVKKMEEAGVEFARYNSPVSLKFFRANHRSHRKLLVVDGAVGFTGGVCLSDDWGGNADPPKWRDTHFRVEGPVVGQMQAVFIDNWLQSRSEILHGRDYFPHIKGNGSMRAQCFKSGPREGSESARLAYMLSFAAAKKTIRISHAYFVPDSLVIKALLDARARGVKVQILFPRKIDNIAVRKASWAQFGQLIENGVEFYEYQPTLYHCKIVIVDDMWAMVGSVNFDERSMRINDEINMNVLDEAFAKKLVESFDDDKRHSKVLKKEDFRKRTIFVRFFDHFAGLFRSQL